MHDDDSISNHSGNRPFEDVLRGFQSRRNMLKGGIGAATMFFAACSSEARAPRKSNTGDAVNFTPVPLAGGGGAEVRISADYRYQVLIPWGDPLYPGSADTIGIGHDGMSYFSVGTDHGVLAVNHEYGNNEIVIGKRFPENLEEVRLSQYNHGISVVEIAKGLGRTAPWSTVNTLGVARRIHANTPVEFSGPVAGSALLRNPAGNQPMGTLNNCANGHTPWGTYLTCEENFNGYFGATGAWEPTAEQQRYGFSAGSNYGWHMFDPRFDLSNPDYVNEDKRFGWIVEIDPMNPARPPVKRTALGRVKHEGIALAEGRGGRVVGYMGDDQRFDYIYKFVSADNWRSMLARGISPLDEGTLYVARFNDDGSGDWLELSMNNPVLAAEFGSEAEILTFARNAADLAGATPMDRPEWTTVAPNGLVYCTLTNNSRRTETSAANPLAPNYAGHIIRWLDSDQYVGTSFTWDIFVIAEETHGSEASFASPDGLWADPYGRLFIQTDGSQADGLNNQMLVANIATGETRRLLEGVNGCEVTGIAATPDQTTLFANLQHPSPDSAVPRDATLVITRNDDGIVGS